MTVKRKAKPDRPYRVVFYLSGPEAIKELQLRAQEAALTPGQMARFLVLAMMRLADKPGAPQPPADGNLGELMDGPWNKPR
jgi:hypothetical protein